MTHLSKKEIKKLVYYRRSNLAVGRLAAYISTVLRGKNKPTFNPHIDNGDFVVVTNIDKIKFTGKNLKIEILQTYWSPRWYQETTSSRLSKKNKSAEILKLAVKRMLPGGPLAKKQLTKLKIYNSDKHPHDVQNPKTIEFDKLNKLNIVK